MTRVAWQILLVLAAISGAAACSGGDVTPHLQIDESSDPMTTTTVASEDEEPAEVSTSTVASTSSLMPTTTVESATAPEVEPPRAVAGRCRPAEELQGVTAVGTVRPGPWPRPPASPRELSSVATGAPILSLTFDAEQDPTPVPALLDVLERHGVLTTFFVLAPWAESNPGLVASIEAAGHEVGNHSYAHERMAEWTPEAIVAELERAEAALTSLGVEGTRPWLRPPFGNRSPASVAAAYDAGWTTVRWSDGTDDSVEGTPSEVEDSLCSDLLSGASRGAVLISHTFNPNTPAAIDRFIAEMHDLGLVFVPLSVLAAPDPLEFVDLASG